MLKLILFFAFILLAGFLIVNDHWFITVTGFGYEITVSSLLLFFAILLCIYLFHLLKSPFRFIRRIRGKCTQNKQGKRELYFMRVMQAFLENNEAEKKQLLKEKKNYFDKKEKRQFIIEALLEPKLSVFEELSKQSDTELAGLYGEYEFYKKEGNLKEQELILKRAAISYPNMAWVNKGLFDLMLLQQDWEKAIEEIEQLKKLQLIEKESYRTGLAGLYLKIGKVKEAYALDKENPAIALAYATENPNKAIGVLSDLWKTTPNWEAYLAYMNLFKDETNANQMKALKKLIAGNPTNRLSLLAMADLSVRLELWSNAKETMEVYLQTYPHTHQALQLMADIIRKGWHHEGEAREWENKPVESEDLNGWQCMACHHRTREWDVVCPSCNAFNQITYK